MEYVLETRALEKQYKNFKALHDLNMHVPKGSIYGFVGKNGAGKTTLIRIISGLQHPTSGEYLLFGESSKRNINKARRRMGAVVETPSIYLNMSAEENIKAQLTILGLPADGRIEELLELVGLSDTGKKKAGDFSLGMRQRLGIAIALAGSPDFLVLDEPVNGLDPQGIIEIRELILKLNRQMGITVLISSHILDELSRIATHYGFLDAGHMVKEISADEIELSCRKKQEVTVSDTVSFAVALEKLGLEYQVVNGKTVKIYGEISVTDIVTEAGKADCEIYAIKEQDESLESFYLNLLGGGSDE